MTTITLAGVVFHDDGTPGWNFRRLRDWRGVPDSKQQKPSRPPGQSGTFRSFDTSRDGVTPSFDVIYTGSSEAEALAAWDDLAAAVSPVAEVLMTVADALHTTSRMVTIRRAELDDHRGLKNILGSIDCHAADAFRYGTDHVATTGLPVSGGGFRWNARWPARWGTGGDPGRAIQLNSGKQPTSKNLLAVSGGLDSGFSVINIEDGREIRLERVIPAGQTAYVDLRTGRAYLDTPANDITSFLTRYTPWSVPAGGLRTLQFNSLGGSSGTPTLTATTSPAFL